MHRVRSAQGRCRLRNCLLFSGLGTSTLPQLALER